MREKPRPVVEIDISENVAAKSKKPPELSCGGLKFSDVNSDLSPRRTRLHHCHQNNYFAARVGIEH